MNSAARRLLQKQYREIENDCQYRNTVRSLTVRQTFSLSLSCAKSLLKVIDKLKFCRTAGLFDGSIEDGIDDIERDHAGANDRAGGDRPP